MGSTQPRSGDPPTYISSEAESSSRPSEKCKEGACPALPCPAGARLAARRSRRRCPPGPAPVFRGQASHASAPSLRRAVAGDPAGSPAVSTQASPRPRRPYLVPLQQVQDVAEAAAVRGHRHIPTLHAGQPHRWRAPPRRPLRLRSSAPASLALSAGSRRGMRDAVCTSAPPPWRMLTGCSRDRGCP